MYLRIEFRFFESCSTRFFWTVQHLHFRCEDVCKSHTVFISRYKALVTPPPRRLSSTVCTNFLASSQRVSLPIPLALSDCCEFGKHTPTCHDRHPTRSGRSASVHKCEKAQLALSPVAWMADGFSAGAFVSIHGLASAAGDPLNGLLGEVRNGHSFSLLK